MKTDFQIPGEPSNQGQRVHDQGSREDGQEAWGY